MTYPAYPEYKDSGVEWLGNLPKHWVTKPLKYVSEINSDVLNENTDKEYEFEYIDIGSVSSGGKIQKTESMKFASAPSRARRLVKNGDVIISTVRTYLRAIAPITEHTEKYVVSTGFSVVTPVKEMHPEYCSYMLQSPYFVETVVAGSVGVSYPATNASDIANIDVCLPAHEEQKQIAAFLDRETKKIDRLIEKQQQLIKLLQEKRQALISHAVTKGLPAAAAAQAGLNPDVKMKDSGVEWLGEIPEHWEVIQIKRLTMVARGASPRPIDDPKYFDDDGEYAWVRISDVTASDTYLTKTTQRLSALGASLSVKLEPGEFFLSIAGSVGKPCITKIKACIHDGFVYFPYLKENPKFLFYIFAAGEAYKGLGKMGTQLNLNTDTVGWIKIGLPPLEEQKQIVDYIDRETKILNQLEGKCNEAISLSNDHRKNCHPA